MKETYLGVSPVQQIYDKDIFCFIGSVVEASDLRARVPGSKPHWTNNQTFLCG